MSERSGEFVNVNGNMTNKIVDWLLGLWRFVFYVWVYALAHTRPGYWFNAIFIGIPNESRIKNEKKKKLEIEKAKWTNAHCTRHRLSTAVKRTANRNFRIKKSQIISFCLYSCDSFELQIDAHGWSECEHKSNKSRFSWKDAGSRTRFSVIKLWFFTLLLFDLMEMPPPFSAYHQFSLDALRKKYPIN